MDRQEYLEQIERVISEGPYQDTWESLCTHPVPKWYRDAKFGIFIHWGIYSVPAFKDEWYSRNVYRKGSAEYNYHVENYGNLSEFGYKDFIPMFRAEKFEPAAWAALFKKAGARYVMPVGEHTDGFQMYDSALSKWNAKQMGPKRDVLGELKEAIEAQGMVFTTSSHRAEHWWFYNLGRETPEADVNDERYADFYGPAAGPTRAWGDFMDNPPDEEFLEDWLVRTCELVDRYQPSDIYFDWWIQTYAFKPYLKKFAAYYYNQAHKWGVDVAINAKFDAFVHGSVVKDVERGQMGDISPDFWQNDTSVAKNSWGYTKNNVYKDAKDIICNLVDVVSKNGSLLLNIGPKPDGTIPKEDEALLLEIGKWLEINGEAIYDTKYWKIYGEGPTAVPDGEFTDTQREAFTSEDIRFTSKADVVYAIVMKWPENGMVKIKSMANIKYLRTAIRDIEILGQNVKPFFEFRDSLEVSAGIEADDKPVVLKIYIE